MSDKKTKYILIGILGILLFISLIIPGFLSEAISGARSKAPDARAVADMAQLRSIAELIYDDEGSYINVNCDYGNAKLICDDIKKMVGSKPIIHQTVDKYCAYVQLNDGAFVCVDSKSTFQHTTWINPSSVGYCDGKTFLCPAEEGTPPPVLPLPPKKMTLSDILTWIVLIGGGVITFWIIIFSWRQAFKRRKEEVIKEETLDLIIKEIKSKKWFYVLTILLVLSIMLTFLFFSEGYELPISLATFIFLSPLFVLGGIFLSISGPIKKAWRDKTEMMRWESYVAALCLGIFWFISFYYVVLVAPEEIIGIVIFLVILYVLGTGLSISCLIHRGKLNKIIGIFLLLVFLLIGLIILRLLV